MPSTDTASGGGTGRLRIVIAEDAALLREGLTRLLVEQGLEVCGAAADAGGLLELVEQHQPDVALTDIRMPPTHTDEGLVAAEQIRERFPQVGVLVLSQYVDADYVLRLLDGSAGTRCGYLLKDNVTRPAELVTSLERIHAGEVVVDRELISGLLAHRREVDPLYDLTDREREVLALMAEGLSDKGIATRLWVSPKTVEAHVRHILQKLQIPADSAYNRRVHAVIAFLGA